jgi:ribosomal protein L37AE/L43A
MSFARMLCTVTVGFLMMAIVGGCASTSGSASTAMPQKAIVVTGGNSGGTAIFIPNADNTDVEMMSTTGEPMCPQCRADAIKYFQTGVLVPKCSMCGATRTPVSTYPPTFSHN